MVVGGQMGREFFTVLKGSHTLFGIATKSAHAEALANEVAMLLLQYSPEIRHRLCFRDFQLQEIGAVSLLEGSGGQYAVPVTFSHVSTFEWTLDKDLPPLRHIDIKVLYGLTE
jgi:hypothetical protein